jgi:hypothetical protein
MLLQTVERQGSPIGPKRQQKGSLMILSPPAPRVRPSGVPTLGRDGGGRGHKGVGLDLRLKRASFFRHTSQSCAALGYLPTASAPYSKASMSW